MSEDPPDILPEVPEVEVYTVKEYLQDISPLLTEGVLRAILAKRRLSPEIPLEELDERELDLAEAEVYYHLSSLPVGGWTVSGANLAEWYRKYAALRERWGEEVIAKRKIRIINL